MLRIRRTFFQIIRRNYAFDKYNLTTADKFKIVRDKIKPSAYALLIFLPGTTFALGVWQIFRRRQKLDKINQIKERTKMKPIELPLDLRELSDLEYTPVRLFGEFQHDKEFVIKPRQRLDEHFPTAIKGATFFDLGTQHGGLVVTPFKPVGRDYTVLVARGWVPPSHSKPETRLEGQVKGQVEIVGITRNPEKQPTFVSSSRPELNFYPYRDIISMAQYHDTAPHYFELTYESSVPNGPVGGQTLISLPNNHFTYILTWFSVSASTLFLWYKRFVAYSPKF